MSKSYKYKTIAESSEAEISEKKSNFLAVISPVSTEEEARSFVDKIRKKHYNASHNVYAYRVGIDREISRYSDDGEPSGTAGIPILNILNGEKLVNIVIVVTRYFGGTLLGTGGLVRAYSAAARAALSNALIIEKNLYSIMEIDIDYALSGKLEYEVLKNQHFIHNIIYESSVIFTVLVEHSQSENFKEIVMNISNANAKIDIKDNVFGTKIKEKIIIDSDIIPPIKTC